MKSFFFKAIASAVIFCAQTPAPAQSLDQIGVTLLRATTTNLNGAGIRVAQAEASAPAFEVNPAAVGQPASLFTYLSDDGSSSVFPNSVGTESGHANGVGGYFYGLPGGVATNVVHVDNYDADHFFNDLISAPLPAGINAPVANQSFIFCNDDFSHFPASMEQDIDSQYDDYAAQFKTLFISGAGNGGPTNQAQVFPAATCYNGLGVAAYGGNSCIGPTLDNGRCKPDITAPAGVTSFSTPQVAGAAALLMQAALRGDGGNDTNSTFDMRTIKALLLNGAVKPANWTNSNSSPLDARYGAGIVNVFNSYRQLAGGKQDFTVSSSVSLNAAHPPNGATGAIGVLNGWNFSTNASGVTADTVQHYYFNVTNGVASAKFTATATLVWNRQKGKSSINNLDLFLYDCASSNLVACSTSVVDNVEHVFVPQLAPGRYDLQVWKAGSIPGVDIISAAEPYALAWTFYSENLTAQKSGTNLILSWPVYPAGFVVQSATNLASPNWNMNNLPASIVTNNQNIVSLNATNTAQFFRLRQP